MFEGRPLFFQAALLHAHNTKGGGIKLGASIRTAGTAECRQGGKENTLGKT